MIYIYVWFVLPSPMQIVANPNEGQKRSWCFLSIRVKGCLSNYETLPHMVQAYPLHNIICVNNKNKSNTSPKCPCSIRETDDLFRFEKWFSSPKFSEKSIVWQFDLASGWRCKNCTDFLDPWDPKTRLLDLRWVWPSQGGEHFPPEMLFESTNWECEMVWSLKE